MSTTLVSPRPRFATKGRAPQVALEIPAGDESLRELDGVMLELIESYEQLHRLGILRHEAMKRADTSTLASVIERESIVVQNIAETEKKRIRVVGSLSEKLGSKEKSQTTVTWIAQRSADPSRTNLLQRASRLRELISSVKELNETSKAAAEMLATHMQGLMRQVQGKVNRAETYGRMGTFESRSGAGRTLDITS